MRPAAEQGGSASGQAWTSEGYVRHAGFVADLGGPVLDLLAARAGERILDLGCGDGRLTAAIAAAGADLLGLDASPELLAQARGRGLEVRLGDGQALDFEQEFDAVFSNAALHWMADAPQAVVEGIFRALKPGGRFVGEFGGHGNVAAITTALRAALLLEGIDGASVAPWFFPSADAYRLRLERVGFKVEEIGLLPRPTPLPTDMEGWLETFAGPFLVHLPEDRRLAARRRAVALLAPALLGTDGIWTADYVRLRFRASRPMAS